MTHISLPRLFPRSSVSHGERRLAYQQAPGSNLNQINNLFMRESVAGDEVTKNQYAYDTVQDRVREYQTRATALLTTLGQIGEKRGRDTISTIRAPLDGGDRDLRTVAQLTRDLLTDPREQQLRFRVASYPNFIFCRTADGRFYSQQTGRAGAPWMPYNVNAQLFYRNAIVIENNGVAVTPQQNYLDYSPSYSRWAMGQERFSKTENTYRYQDIVRYSVDGRLPARAEGVSRVYWDVVRLERHYIACEQLIRRLEIDAGVRNASGNPVDGEQTLEQRMLTARTEALATQMQAAGDAAKLQTISLDMYSRPFDTIGEAQVYKLLRVPADVTAEFTRAGGEIREEVGTPIMVSGGVKYYRIPQSVARTLNTGNTRLRLTRGGSVFTEGGRTSVATISRSGDGLNNLIFTFEAAREQERNIEVNSLEPMYTGRNGTFEVTAAGPGDAASADRALNATTVTVGTTNVPLPEVGEYTAAVNGVRFRRLPGAGFRVVAESVGTTAATVPVRFARAGQPAIERQVRILTIDASPDITFREGSNGRIRVIPLTQGVNAAVSMQSVDRPNDTTPYNIATIPGSIGTTEVRTPGNNIVLTYEDGVLTAVGEKAGRVNVYFYHGNQRIMRTIEVTRAPETIEVNQPEPMYTGFRRRVEIGPPGMSAERRRATIVEFNGQTIPTGGSASIDGVSIERDADGNLTVTGTNELGGNVAFTVRGGPGTAGNTVNVNVEIKNIAVSPERRHQARAGAAAAFTVDPLEVTADQGHPTFVSLTRLAGRPPYTEAPAGAVGDEERIQDGFGLTFVNGVLNVRDTTPNASYRTLRVYFYNGHQMIEREIEGGELQRIIGGLNAQPFVPGVVPND